MKRTFALGAAAALAAAVALGATALPAAGDNGANTIAVFEHQTEFNAITQQAQGPSVDDSFALSSDLYTNSSETTRVGHAGVSCVQTSITRGPQGEAECDFTLLFADGQITATGLVDLADATTPGGRFIMPVVGGTGRYRDARGQVDISVINQTDSQDTVTLA